MERSANPVARRVRHGPVARLALVATGLLLAALSALVIVALLVAAVRSHGGKAAGFLAGCLPFAGLAAYGSALTVRGLRGSSAVGERMARLDRWLPRRLNLVWLLLGAAGGAVVLISTGGRSPVMHKLDPSRSFLWYALVAMLALPACIAIHELGHAAAGWAVGLPVSSLRIGPLLFGRTAGGRMGVSWDTSVLGHYLGLARVAPFREPPSPWRYAVFVAGGPFFTVLATLAWYEMASSAAPSPVGAAGAGAVLWAAFFANLMLLPSSVIPFQTRSGVATDAALLLFYALPGSPSVRLAREMSLQPAARRPRQWGVLADDLVRAADADPRMRPALLLYALAVALDQGNRNRADGILERALADLARFPPNHAYDLQLQAVLVDALLRGAAARARERLDRLDGHPTVVDFYPLLARAAVLAAEGRPEEAAEALARWKATGEASGLADYLAARNQWALDVLQARLSPSPPGSGGPESAGPAADRRT